MSSDICIDSIKFRPLLQVDLRSAHGLSMSVKWPHRYEDWCISFDCGRGFGAFHGNELVGVILWWRHGEQMASLGTLIVSEKYQRRGIARRLLQSVIDAAEDRRLMLNATTLSAPIYQSLGFIDTGYIMQFQGVLMLPGTTKPVCIPDGIHIYELQSEDEDGLLQLDRRACGGGDRSIVLELIRAESVARVAVRDGRVVAYALCREFGYGRLVGPVVAESELIALTLIAATLESLPSGFVRMDIPCISTNSAPPMELCNYLIGAGLVCVARDVRSMMRNGSNSTATPITTEEKSNQASSSESARIYGLASQAIG
jgi:predicted N-acetyltransferase YhbS